MVGGSDGLQLLCEDQEQRLRIAPAEHMAALRVELCRELRDVGEVAVVREHDSRMPSLERLSVLLGRCGSRGRVADVCDADITRHVLNPVRTQHTRHHAQVLGQVPAVTIKRRRTGRVLPAMLNRLQSHHQARGHRIWPD